MLFQQVKSLFLVLVNLASDLENSIRKRCFILRKFTSLLDECHILFDVNSEEIGHQLQSGSLVTELLSLVELLLLNKDGDSFVI